MDISQPDAVAVLDRSDCIALMRTASVGRVAYTEGALPAVQPVSFVLGDGEVFLPTHPGSAVAVASRGAVVAFEVDEVDLLSRSGWTVTVVGRSRLVADPGEIARLDALGVRPWIPGTGQCYIGITFGLVRGRLVRAPVSAWAVGRYPQAALPR